MTRFYAIDESRIHLAELRLRAQLAQLVQIRVNAARAQQVGCPLNDADAALLDQHGVTYTVVHVIP